MKSLYSLIILLSVAGLSIALYHFVQAQFNSFKEKQAKIHISKKNYEDEKALICDYLRSLLPQLESGRLQWILIFSRIFPSVKAEITFNSIIRLYQILNYGRRLRDEEMQYLNYLGMSDYRRSEEMHLVFTEANAKVITDIIYFLFEKIHDQAKAVNIKVHHS